VRSCLAFSILWSCARSFAGISFSAQRKEHKQDHLVCFLGGSLMLGATDGGHADVPPKPEQFSTAGQQRDWNTGVELIKTCMETHKSKT